MASNGPEKKVGAAKIVSSTVKSDENSADDVNYQDLTQFMQTFFQQMEEKFQAASDQILGKIDLMSQRIDELEKNIAELSTQAAMEERPPLPPSANA